MNTTFQSNSATTPSSSTCTSQHRLYSSSPPSNDFSRTSTPKCISIGPTQSILAGGFAGCVTRSCTSPLDVVKIHFQLNSNILNTTAGSIQSGGRFLSNALGTTVRNLYALEGYRGFWKGNVAGCCRLAPYAGVKFVMFDTLKTNAAAAQNKPLSTKQHAVFGALSGMLATVCCYPLEVVRTRMIVQSPGNAEIKGAFDGLFKIHKVEGMRGLYRGCMSGLVGAIPFEGVQFASYEFLKSYSVEYRWPRWRWPEEKSSLVSVDFLAIGALSGGLAQTVAYPFDSIKKRLQVQRGNGTCKYNGMVDCFRKVCQEEGPLALYRGTVPNMIRIMPYAAVMFSTYEAAKKFLLWVNNNRPNAF